MRLSRAAQCPRLADFRHRVLVCTSPVMGEGGLPVLKRSVVFSARAAIENYEASAVSTDGWGVKPTEAAFSHMITLRAPRDVVLTTSAWVYFASRIVAPRWFKVMHLAEVEHTKIGRLVVLNCRLYETGDVALPPSSGVVPVTALDIA